MILFVNTVSTTAVSSERLPHLFSLPGMTCKISLRSRREYLVIGLDARPNYLDKRGFLQPRWAGAVRARVGRAVDVRHRRALRRLQVGAALRGRVAQQVAFRPGVRGHAVGPAAQAGGLRRGGTAGDVL